MGNRLRLIAVAGLATATVLLTGCQDGTKVGASASITTNPAGAPVSETPTSAPTGGGSDAGAGPATTANIRIANFFAPKDEPGPGLDIYDVALRGQPATPILTNVAYGTVSDYVHPHQILNDISKEVILTALPTGEDPVTQKGDASEADDFIDDGSGYQATTLLTAGDEDGSLGSGTSLLGILSQSTRMEKGDNGKGGQGGPARAAPPIIDGGGEILEDQTAIPNNLNPSLYLMIDDSCAPPLNGSSDSAQVPYATNNAAADLKSVFAVFATTPGTHQVSVVSWDSSTPPTCKQLTKRQGTVSVDVAANQQVELYVYGKMLTALHLVAAPVQP